MNNEEEINYVRKRLAEAEKRRPRWVSHFEVEEAHILEDGAALLFRRDLPDGSTLRVWIAGSWDRDLFCKEDGEEVLDAWERAGHDRNEPAPKSWWYIIQTIHDVTDGFRVDDFNPQATRNRRQHNFKWVLPYSWENLARILHEVERRALRSSKK
jgi:hypothetical protein